MKETAEKISDSEAEIMKVLWDSGKPTTYTHIRRILTDRLGWEGPTINTLVNRLVKKGILTQEKREVFYYFPTVQEEEYMELKTKTFVEKVYSGDVKGLMSALLTYENVSKEDMEELQDYWEKARCGDE